MLLISLPKKLVKILKGITATLIAAAVMLAILLAGVRLFGLQVYTVISGSMEPAYPIGSLIYVRQVDTDTLQEGDVITFTLGGSVPATHRIIEVLPDGSFRTQGDANPNPDGSPVAPENVLGSPIFKIPGLGYAAAYIQSPLGRSIVIGAGVTLTLLILLLDQLDEDQKKGPSSARHIKK